MKCPICDCEKTIVVYSGLVKHGRGNKSPHIVYECVGCRVQRLDQFYNPHHYENGEYRELLEEPEWKYGEHDQRQLLIYTHLPSMRNKVVVDVGCGGGSFLDLIYGVSKEVIGIEPDENYQDRPYRVYPYMKDAPQGIADVAVSFDVIEHTEDPVEFLTEISNMIKPGGDIYIVTPNRDELLMRTCPQYKEFWYKTVHNWYFDSKSLSLCGARAGLECVNTDMVHRFGIENTLLWFSEQTMKLPNSEALNLQWKQYLKENNLSEFILMHFRGRGN